MRLGIIGYGGMAGWHHKHANAIEGIKVTAAYDIDKVRVQVARDNGLEGFDTLDAFLNSDLFDTVLVATPNDTHCQLVKAALGAGKHVLCEKPVAMNLKELDEMIDAAKAANRLFTVHQNRRWDKDFLTAWEVIRSGSVGSVFSIQSRLHGSGGVVHGWRGEKAHGGGMLFDWGVHFLDQLALMLGYDNILSVNCKFAMVKTDEVDDYLFLTLNLADGSQAQVEIGTFVLKELPRWMILGDRATAYINDFSANGAIVELDSTLEDTPVLIMTANGPTRTFSPRPDNVKIEKPLPAVEADNTVFYKNLRDAVAGDAELIVQPWQVRRVMQIIEAGFASAASGETVALEA